MKPAAGLIGAVDRRVSPALRASRQPYSGVSPAVFTSTAHFFTSARITLANSSGDAQRPQRPLQPTRAIATFLPFPSSILLPCLRVLQFRRRSVRRRAPAYVP